MDFLERKNNTLLQRLRQLQKDQCCRHIDKQIRVWYRNEIADSSQPSLDLPSIEPFEEVVVVDEIVPDGALLEQPSQPVQLTEPILEVRQELEEKQGLDAQTESPQELETRPKQEVEIEAKKEEEQESESELKSQPQSQPQAETETQLQSQLQPQTSSHTLPQMQPQLEAHSHSEHFTSIKNRDPDDIAPTVGCFLSNIKHLESFDSDATESTSSNDSYDELEGFSLEEIPPKRTNYPNIQPSSDLKKKAIWKWANERSRLASRWTWLQAQVADLEFRIRGQNDATIHARSGKTHPLPPFTLENSCSRTVPISRDFRRRRLIRASQILSDSNKRLVKFSHVPCVCSSLPQTVAPCISCNGRYNYLRQLDGENMSLSERISLLDPCCHPVLSFPDDLTLGSQLAYLLKQETINRRPTKGRPGRKKGSTAANLAAAAAAAAANGDSNARHQGRKGKYYHGMVGRPPGSASGLKNPSQTMITSNKLRRKYRKHSSTSNYGSNNWVGSSNHIHSSRRNKRIRRASSMNDGSNCSESSNQYRPHSFSNNNSAQNVTRRRRSEQSAYDIDNIVIPFSIAATTRVEILEYKEIVTPSWRVWENGTCQTESVEEDVEDTSDEAYISRHSKGESEEKKRFSLKPPPGLVKMKSEQ